MDYNSELRRLAGYVLLQAPHPPTLLLTNDSVACDWWHNLPQLFWKVDYYNYAVSSCAEVELVTEAVGA